MHDAIFRPSWALFAALLAGCPKAAPEPAGAGAAVDLPPATWFDIETGKPVCISSVPSAEPLPAADRAAFAAAVDGIIRGEPSAALGTLATMPEHPAPEHAGAMLGLLLGEPGAAQKLIELSEAWPSDPCLAAMAAIGAASIEDLDAAATTARRARELAPEDARIAFLSWWLGLEDAATLAPALEAGLAAEPDNGGLLLAVGLDRTLRGDPSGIELLERALDAGMLEAAGALLAAYRDQHRQGDYVALASEVGILGDEGAVAAAADPLAAWHERLGLAEGEALTATFHTSLGTFRCRLLPEVAPVAVSNFVGLARGTAPWIDPRDGTRSSAPLYDGTVFHRVIPGFMVQGGDPLGTGTGDPGYRYPDEVDPEVRFDRPGRLALANNGPDSNGSQFFVTEAAVPHLDGRHTIFGTCDEAAVAVVSKIARVPVDEEDRPVEPVRLEKIEVSSGPEGDAPKETAPTPAPEPEPAPSAAPSGAAR